MIAQDTQCMQALRRANRVRVANSVLLKELFALSHADGIERAAEIIEACEHPADALSVRRLLLSVRRLGDAKAVRVLNHADIRSGDRKLRDVTDRQRHLLAEGLRNRVWIRFP